MKYVKLFLLTTWLFSLSSMGSSQKLPPNYVPQLDDNSTQSSSTGLFRVGEVKGTVKNKGVYLPKPEYPPEAIFADAEGEVRVQITIDDEGNVISANVTTGHESLKSVCEDTARRTKFRIYRIDGQAVSTSGELVYQFEIQKAGWTQIGAHFSGFWTGHNITFVPILKAFPSDWSKERETLEGIAKARRDRGKYSPSLALQTPTLVRTTTKTANGSTLIGVVTRRQLSLPDAPTPEQIAVFQQLIASVRTRLTDDRKALWQFNLGIALSSVFPSSRDPFARADLAASFRQMIKNAPTDTSPVMLSDIARLAAKIEFPTRSGDDYREVSRLINHIISN